MVRRQTSIRRYRSLGRADIRWDDCGGCEPHGGVGREEAVAADAVAGSGFAELRVAAGTVAAGGELAAGDGEEGDGGSLLEAWICDFWADIDDLAAAFMALGLVSRSHVADRSESILYKSILLIPIRRRTRVVLEKPVVTVTHCHAPSPLISVLILCRCVCGGSRSLTTRREHLHQEPILRSSWDWNVDTNGFVVSDMLLPYFHRGHFDGRGCHVTTSGVWAVDEDRWEERYSLATQRRGTSAITWGTNR